MYLSTIFPLLVALFLFARSTLSQSTPNCPLLGSVFPAASNPENTDVVKAAQKAFPDLISEAFSSGHLDNSTSFSINIFSASNNESLFAYHYNAPALNGTATTGEINDDTIYRIGSVSKLLTVYTWLQRLGDLDFNQPITKFIPELKQAESDAGQNDIDNVRWSEVTILGLISHMAAITRDCECAIDALLASIELQKAPCLRFYRFCTRPVYNRP